jgi:4-hydroxybutyrate CoA-transferase
MIRSSDNRATASTFGLGSAEMYEFLHENSTIGFAPVQHVNDPTVIASNPSMASINSAVATE